MQVLKYISVLCECFLYTKPLYGNTEIFLTNPPVEIELELFSKAFSQAPCISKTEVRSGGVGSGVD